MRKSISTTYIKQNLAYRPLLNNAIAQIVIKILFENDHLDIDTLYTKMEKILSHPFSKTRLEEVLIDLEKESKLKKSNNNFSLRKSYRYEIESIKKERDSRFKYALGTYFKNYPYDSEIIKNWFDEMNVAFFTEYSSEWIEDLIGRSKRKKTYVSHFETLNDKNIFNKHKIKYEHRAQLVNDFILYLRSNDQYVAALMMDYANSLFAAKLITANIFADKSIVDILSDSKVIIDTNVLLPLNLEKDKYSDSYDILEKIFLKLNIKPVYLHGTKEEYIRVIDYKIDLLKNLLYKYDMAVLKKSTDVFIQTLIYRNCSEDEHFENYYNSLREIPSIFKNSLPIVEEDYYEINEYIAKSKDSKKVKQKMNEIYLRNHDEGKKDKSLQHDSELIIGAQFLQKNEKAWILTRDGTVHTYAIENKISGNMPLALTVDTIISLLSVNDGGVDLDPSEFGSVFAQFVMNDVVITRDAFKIEDLTKMIEIESEIASLPSEQIIEIAREINHDRFIGAKESEIALKIQRKMQSYRIEIKDELSATQIKLANEKKENDALLDIQERIKTGFKEKRTSELKDSKLSKFKKKVFLEVIGQIVIMILATAFAIYILKHNNESQTLIVNSIIGVLINLITGYFSIKKLWFPTYLKGKDKIIKTIEREVEDEWENLKKKDV